MRQRILKQCLQLAIKHTHPDNDQWNCFMHFSFIVYKNKILGYGMNQNGSAPISYPDHSKIHSEVNAYKKCKHLLKDKTFEMVNIRLTKKKSIRLSKPCKCCYSFLQNLNCRKIWFSTKCGFASLKL